MSIHPCNLDAIYNESFSYSLPRPLLESFLSGKAFDHKREYTPAEREKLHADIRDLFQATVTGESVEEPLAVISAGAPGAGKTTLMRQKLAERATPYVCPDDVCLQGQTRTYQADIAAGNGSFEAREAAYTKWRPASNAATHILLAHLIKEKRPFFFGTTCSSDKTYLFFQFLKSHGYRVKVIHVSAPDDVRWESIQKRDETFVQTTEEDTCEKGRLVPQRIHDTFLSYADEIEFHYRSDASSEAIHAATWTQEKMTILDSEAYEDVKKVHNAAIAALEMPELSWEKTVESSADSLQL